MFRVRTNKGFTLVEAIIVITIVGIIGSIGVASILTATDAVAFLTVRSHMDQSADVAMSRMAEEIVRLRNDASITVANVNQFSFIDIDGNSISYSLSGIDLIRTTLTSSDILASDVGGLTFRYFADDGNELVVPGGIILSPLTNIRRIQVLLTLQGGSYTFEYQTQVRPRNLRHLCYKFK